jgi:hypothetical protein
MSLSWEISSLAQTKEVACFTLKRGRKYWWKWCSESWSWCCKVCNIASSSGEVAWKQCLRLVFERYSVWISALTQSVLSETIHEFILPFHADCGILPALGHDRFIASHSLPTYHASYRNRSYITGQESVINICYMFTDVSKGGIATVCKVEKKVRQAWNKQETCLCLFDGSIPSSETPVNIYQILDVTSLKIVVLITKDHDGIFVGYLMTISVIWTGFDSRQFKMFILSIWSRAASVCS